MKHLEDFFEGPLLNRGGSESLEYEFLEWQADHADCWGEDGEEASAKGTRDRRPTLVDVVFSGLLVVAALGWASTTFMWITSLWI